MLCWSKFKDNKKKLSELFYLTFVCSVCRYNITNLQGCKALHAEVLVRLVHLEGVAVIDKLDGS